MLTLQAAKAKESDIFAKLSKVQDASTRHKEQTKLNQQRLEWIQQAKKLVTEARHLDTDLQEASSQLGLVGELMEEKKLADESTSDVWFQVAGVRQLLWQVKQRDVERLCRSPEQAIELQGVLASVAVAISSLGAGLANQAATLERERVVMRQAIRPELVAEGLWSAERTPQDRVDLSDEEDTLLERIGEGPETYEGELRHLNDAVSGELAQLEQELTELRKKRAGWNDEAHFRFACIKRQFQGKGRDLLLDRLALEFPHLAREQLQAHEANCDALKYAAQRQAAAFRGWRRDRLAMLRQHQGRLDERQKAEGEMAVRRQSMVEQRDKNKHLHSRLQVERARVSEKRDGQRREAEAERLRREAAEAEREDKQRKHAQVVKELSQQHAEKKRELGAKRAEEAEERERREAQERADRLERNADIVALRRKMDELKQREEMQRRQSMADERNERQHRMNLLMDKLKVEAPRDPERLHKRPAHAGAEAYLDPLVCVTRGPHAGFDEKRLMADARYKISAALQAAGLFGTKAGHEAMARVAPPRHAAASHFVSSVFPTAPGGYPA